mgnify:CR=1 FL=1
MLIPFILMLFGVLASVLLIVMAIAVFLAPEFDADFGDYLDD